MWRGPVACQVPGAGSGRHQRPARPHGAQTMTLTRGSLVRESEAWVPLFCSTCCPHRTPKTWGKGDNCLWGSAFLRPLLLGDF